MTLLLHAYTTLPREIVHLLHNRSGYYRTKAASLHPRIPFRGSSFVHFDDNELFFVHKSVLNLNYKLTLTHSFATLTEVFPFSVDSGFEPAPTGPYEGNCDRVRRETNPRDS